MLDIENKLIPDLEKEPEHLKGNWYDFLTLPFRIFFYPLRALVMNVLAPAAYKKSPDIDINTNDFRIKTIRYSIPRNKNCEMIIAINNQNKEKDILKRKLVITVSGNAIQAESSIRGLVNIDKKVNNDLLAVGFPKYATSSEELVNAIVSAMLRAKNAGYKIENITVTGFSLGGAITALALKKVQKYLETDEKFEGYVNFRSFSDLGAVAVGFAQRKEGDSFDKNLSNAKQFYKEKESSWLGWFVNGFANLLGVQLDAKSALKDSNLPVKQIKIYADDNDKVISHRADFASFMMQHETNIPTKIKVTEKNGHCTNFSKSLYKPSKEAKNWDAKEDLKKLVEKENTFGEVTTSKKYRQSIILSGTSQKSR